MVEKRKTSITLDAALLVRLKVFAAKRSRRIGEIVAVALIEYLDREEGNAG